MKSRGFGMFEKIRLEDFEALTHLALMWIMPQRAVRDQCVVLGR